MLDVLTQDVLELLEYPDNPHEPVMTVDRWGREASSEHDSYDDFRSEVRRNLA